jgi:hypothetical protein
MTHGLRWCLVGSIGHDEIENAITVELSYDYGNRIVPEVRLRASWKEPLP